MAKPRTPANYFGVENPTKSISSLLPEILSDIRKKAGDSQEEVFHFWFELIGESMASLTKPVSLTEGVLTVVVKSATLYSVLCQYEKKRLLAGLQKKFSIRELKFRIG